MRGKSSLIIFDFQKLIFEISTISKTYSVFSIIMTSLSIVSLSFETSIQLSCDKSIRLLEDEDIDTMESQSDSEESDHDEQTCR